MASAKAPKTKRAQSPLAEREDPGSGPAQCDKQVRRTATSPSKQRAGKLVFPSAHLEPLIPRHKMYSYKPSPTAAAANDLLAKVFPVEARKEIEGSVKQPCEAISKLVHVMCASAVLKEQGNLKERKGEKEFRKAFENALVNHLPVREHHRAFLTHNMFVTMIGAVVARALEQATCDQAMKALKLNSKENPEVQKLTLDLLADRYYVRNIACHDSSKTSDVEDVAYSGIMAAHIIKNSLGETKGAKGKVENPARAKLVDAFVNPEGLKEITEQMANVGFKHHYENNPHHPEHYVTKTDNRMADMHVVEAVVDGLACIFERAKPADAQSWLGGFFVARFKNRENRELAEKVISALRSYITSEDYGALEAFRSAVHRIAGESIPWSTVSMTSCCEHKLPREPDRYAKADLSGYFDDKKP